MSFAKAVSFAVFAAVVTACSDVSSPNQSLSAPQSSLTKKSGSTDGRGSSNPREETVSPLVVKTPPTVDVTGTWIAVTDGPDIPHTYTWTLTQTADGYVSGVEVGEGFGTSYTRVIGTVERDTLTLWAGAGTVVTGGQLVLSVRTVITNYGTRFETTFPSHGERVIFYKQ